MKSKNAIEDNRRKTDIDRLLEKQREADERQKRELENLKLCCSELFNNTNGKYLLRFLKRICCWAEEDLNVNHDMIIYKKGRRDIWLILRTLLPKDVLAQIEIYDEDTLSE